MKRELEFHPDNLPGHVNPDDEAQGAPINYLHLALKYKFRLIAGFLLGGFLGYLAYAKSGPEYDAFTQVLVNQKHTPPVREEERVLNVRNKVSDHIPIITSPLFIEKAVKIGALDKLPTFEGETDFVEVVQDGLKVKRAAGSDRSSQTVLEIRYASPSADDAQKVVSAMVDAYADYLSEDSREQATKVQELARTKSNEMLEKLHKAEKAYHDFLMSVPEEYRTALGQKSQLAQSTNIAPEDVIRTLGEERNRNRVRLTELTSRLTAIKNMVSSNVPRDTIESQIRRHLNLDGRAESDPDRQTQISIYQGQLLPLITKEKLLASKVGRDHQDLVAVRNDIDTVLKTFSKLGLYFPEGSEIDNYMKSRGVRTDLITTYLDSLQHQIDEHQIKDRELARQIALEGTRAKDFLNHQTTDQNMRAEIVQLQDSWRVLLDRENSVDVEKDTNGYTMRVLAPVKFGLVIKKPIKYVIGGAAFFTILIAGLCLVQEMRDLTLKNARDVRELTKQPVLGTVAMFESAVDSRHFIPGRSHPGLRYLHAPNSIEAENYRSIRTALLVVAEQRQAKVILISSPEPGDGKTTLVSNLAIALAQSGKRVLLIDADLRRPTVHAMFGLTQDIGLTDVLTGEIDFLNAVRQTKIDRLSLLTAGDTPSNPAEILSLARLPRLLREARDEYDFVFVDAPPMLAVSDPCIIARDVDGLLLVTRLKKNSRASIIRVRDMIESQGIPMLGTVANGVQITSENAYGYYGEYIPSTSAKQISTAADTHDYARV